MSSAPTAHARPPDKQADVKLAAEPNPGPPPPSDLDALERRMVETREAVADAKQRAKDAAGDAETAFGLALQEGGFTQAEKRYFKAANGLLYIWNGRRIVSLTT